MYYASGYALLRSLIQASTFRAVKTLDIPGLNAGRGWLHPTGVENHFLFLGNEDIRFLCLYLGQLYLVSKMLNEALASASW